jgi:hypothetical protein
MKKHWTKLGDLLKDQKGHISNHHPARAFGKPVIKESSSPKITADKNDPWEIQKAFTQFFDHFSGYRNIDWGFRENDQYDWNDRSNYDGLVADYHKDLLKIAKKLEAAGGELDNYWKSYKKVSDKWRKKDGSR